MPILIMPVSERLMSCNDPKQRNTPARAEVSRHRVASGDASLQGL